MQADQHDFHGLLHSASLIEAELRRRLKPLGIQPRQARVLDALSRMGPASQVDLASTFGVTSASMSTMTDRLLKAGYITCTVDPASRRNNVLELTAKGQTLLTGIAQAWLEIDGAIRNVLGQDATAFFDMARKLRGGLGGSIPGKSTRPARVDTASGS